MRRGQPEANKDWLYNCPQKKINFIYGDKYLPGFSQPSQRTPECSGPSRFPIEKEIHHEVVLVTQGWK